MIFLITVHDVKNGGTQSNSIVYSQRAGTLE